MRSAHRGLGGFLATILAATFIGQFDFFVVNVAAPDIQTDLRASNTQLELVVAGYAFTYAAGLVSGGRLGDLLGRRRVFLTGLVAFGVTSALCGLAPGANTLVAFRGLQGLSAAVLLPQVLAFIGSVVPPAQRVRAMGWFGVASGVGSIAGQGLGGLLVQAGLWGLGWRLIFLINLPVITLAVLAALRFVPDARAEAAGGLDLPGAAALFVGMTGLMGAGLLTQHGRGGLAVASAALGVALLAATLGWQRRRARTGRPVTLDPALFTFRSMRWGSLASAAFMAYFASFMFVLTVVLQQHSRLSPVMAGLVFVPSGLTFMLSSLLGSRVIQRNLRAGLLTGCALTGLGLSTVLAATWAGVPAGRLPFWLVGAVSLTGLGNGLILPTLTGLALSDVDADRAGMASGVVTTVQQFGGSLGVTAVAAVFFSVAARAPLPRGMAWSALVQLALLGVVAAASVIATRQAGAVTPRSGQG